VELGGAAVTARSLELACRYFQLSRAIFKQSNRRQRQWRWCWPQGGDARPENNLAKQRWFREWYFKLVNPPRCGLDVGEVRATGSLAALKIVTLGAL